ncbi:MAG: Uncharacterized protein G01um101424_110 [Parcubacteria group bacterium Gr01-1014_24]|nr:MAG: Uncharacterized protein G01um101424_110 [Parcubacteria group bacterium Gr01-1014_24]
MPGEEGPGTNFISRFNPFGSKTTPPVVAPPIDVSGYQPDSGEETPKLKLMKVSSMPIAGFAVFIKERLKEVPIAPLLVEEGVGGGDSSTTPPRPSGTPPRKGGEKAKPTPPLTEFVPALRYAERATGNIYQTFTDKIEERKFSGTTIPKVYEAYFGNRAESVIMRYLKADDKTIETFVGTLPKEYLGGDTTKNNEIKGSFLPNNIKDISLSPDASKIFYLFSSGVNLGNNIVGTTASLLDNKKVQVFDSPFTEWLSFWPTSKMITLSTKPSSNVPGYMYMLDLDKKNLTKILGDINGLTTLTSPNGKLVLYGDNSLSLYIYHTDNRNSDLLGVKTLPEKCVWGKVSDVIYCAVPKLIDLGAYPDTWYQGEVSFSDQFWKIDIKSGNATLIMDPVTVTAEEIDGIKLDLDESENYLFFVNKKDSFLWKLDLK